LPIRRRRTSKAGASTSTAATDAAGEPHGLGAPAASQPDPHNRVPAEPRTRTAGRQPAVDAQGTRRRTRGGPGGGRGGGQAVEMNVYINPRGGVEEDYPLHAHTVTSLDKLRPRTGRPMRRWKSATTGCRPCSRSKR
jgi:hypothetical protein